MENDMSVNTSGILNDGGTALDQNDIQTFIKVLIEQRNDAQDNLAVFRTKAVRYVSTLTMMSENLQKLTTENQEAKAKIEKLEAELASYNNNSVADENTIDHD